MTHLIDYYFPSIPLIGVREKQQVPSQLLSIIKLRVLYSFKAKPVLIEICEVCTGAVHLETVFRSILGNAKDAVPRLAPISKR